ncbi:hypothetical protein Golob_013424 [Gossypium lobatum]|uniref:DUF4283 domain-containing protein n=1 Tax=Gossypium lobatum TaxID=34289 RepID=A0A7J8LPC4_9ROSI|nr:hypothetical protein [Gossypium lobatum]
MEDELANLNLADEEEDPVQGQEDDEENEEDFSLCMVGRVLTDSVVHFSSMRNILAELWHLIEWVTISKIENKILFHFYNKIDLKRVLDDVRNPLKRKKHIIFGKDKSTYAIFQYEKISLFYLLCGRLGYGESFCPLRLTLGLKELGFGWNISLKTPPRRKAPIVSRWLREDLKDMIKSGMDMEYIRGSNRCEVHS